MNLVALNGQIHRFLRRGSQANGEHSRVQIVSVVPRELARLVAYYPIFFIKNADSGPLEPVALFGFAGGENLYLNAGVWDTAYVPLQIQRQPFALIPRFVEPSAGMPASLELAVDLDSPHVQASEGERLFHDDGTASAFVQSVRSILSALVGGTREAHAFTARLAELHLLEPVRIDIEFVDGSKTNLEGLYWIAAAALKALPAAQLADLRDRGYLEWLYLQIASLTHVRELVERKNRRLAAATNAVAPHP